jgi:hypothetical protein
VLTNIEVDVAEVMDRFHEVHLGEVGCMRLKAHETYYANRGGRGHKGPARYRVNRAYVGQL